jgi:hypothetical protein
MEPALNSCGTDVLQVVMEQLKDVSLSLPENPTISEGPVLAIATQHIFDLNFADEKIYAIPSNAFQYFYMEVQEMAKLVGCLM